MKYFTISLRLRIIVVSAITFLSCVICPHACHAAGLGANNLTHAWWDTPGQHFIPEAQTPIHYTMEVFSYDDLHVSSYANPAGNVPGIETDWVVERVSSNLRGELPVVGDHEQLFLLEGTIGERITFDWLVTPRDGYVWPSDSFRLEGVVESHLSPTGGFGAIPAVGTWFDIQDPHQPFTQHVASLGGRVSGGLAELQDGERIVGNCVNNVNMPQFTAPYGGRKEYYDGYPSWIDSGDTVIIDTDNATCYGAFVYYETSGWHAGNIEFWSGLGPQGIGSSTFFPRGEKQERFQFPDDYEPWLHQNEYDENISVMTSRFRFPELSLGSIYAGIMTIDGEFIPLDDGVDDSGIGLYGPGYVGDGFNGPAPASGFLCMGVTWGTGPSGPGTSFTSIPFQGVEVEVVHAVPEPSTLVLLAMGAIGLLACALRQRK